MRPPFGLVGPRPVPMWVPDTQRDGFAKERRRRSDERP
ncbi:antitoxin MazE-like protein [Caballeronia sp. AZ7_KS35]